MPLIQGTDPLNSAGLQPLAFQSADNFVSSPSSQLAQAQAQGQLQQLGDQLALEQKKRKADNASLDYAIAATQHLQDNLPTMAEADRQTLLGQIATAKATIAQRTNEQNTALANAAAGGPSSAGGLTAQETANALAQAKALAQFGQPELAAQLTAQATQNGLNTAQADVPLSKLPNPFQQGILAQATSTGSTLGAFAIPPTIPQATAPAPGNVPQTPASAAPVSAPVPTATPSQTSAPLSNSTATDLASNLMGAKIMSAIADDKTVEVKEPDGTFHTHLLKVSKRDNSILADQDLGVMKTDTDRVAQQSASSLDNIASTQALVTQARAALKDYNAKYGHSDGMPEAFKRAAERMAQGTAADAAGSNSVIAQALGGYAMSSSSRALMQSLQNLNQSIVNLDGETAKGAGGLTPKVGDGFTNPDGLADKLDSLQNYLATRAKTFQASGVLNRFNPGISTETVNKPAVAAPAYKEGDRLNSSVYGPGTIKMVNGVLSFQPDAAPKG